MRISSASGKSRKSELGERIRSILRFHILLMDSSLTDLQLQVAGEYESLMDFEENPHPRKLGRLVSILSNHKLLFGEGFILSEEEIPDDMERLIDYVISLTPRDHRFLRRSSILPRNLGLSFLRKGLGAPLFGLHRPSDFPREPGFLLCYQGPKAEGTGRLAAVQMDDRSRCEYRGLGLEIDSRAPWLHALVLPVDTVPVLSPRGAFSRREPTLFSSNNFCLYISAGKYVTRKSAEFHNPFYFQYTYFFYSSGNVQRHIRRFLRDLLIAMYTFSEDEAEDASRVFTQRLL